MKERYGTENDWLETAPGRWTRTMELSLHARVHVPGEDGRIWDSSVPQGARWTPAVPRANFLIVEEDQEFTLLTPFEETPVFYNWSLERSADSLRIRYDQWLPTCTPERDAASPPRWHTAVFPTRDEALFFYLAWMVEHIPQPERYRPAWTESIPACAMVQLWSGTGEIDHTLDELADMLVAMHDAGVPHDTLVYFWGWFAPFDRKYPEYWPAPEVGGERAFTRVVDTARRYGYRLAPHTNHHGFSTDAPGFADYAADQAIDANGEKCGWREEGEAAIEYMRPSSPRWRAHHISRIKRFVEAFPVDAILWDQYGLLIDDPGCDYFRFLHIFSGELQAAVPNTAILGELFSDRVHDLPVWQQWGTPWCGLPVREEIPHTDLVGRLFSPLVAASFGHQGTPGAVPVPHTWPSYYWYIEHYGRNEAVRRALDWHRSVGCVPTVRVNFREYGLDPKAAAILRNDPLPA